MILRVHHLESLKWQLANFPIVAILGARQVGKTTLARQLENDWDGPKWHFDLEDRDDQARFADPAFVLSELKVGGARRDSTASGYFSVAEGGITQMNCCWRYMAQVHRVSMGAACRNWKPLTLKARLKQTGLLHDSQLALVTRSITD